MSLVSSAARNDLDVFSDVKDVLGRLLAGETDSGVLRPDVWKQSRPEAIGIYRQEERRSRADAKAVKRLGLETTVRPRGRARKPGKGS